MFFEKVRAFFQWLGEKSLARSRKSLDYKWTTYRAEKDESSASAVNARPEAEAAAAVETPQAPTVAVDVDALFAEEKQEAAPKKAAPRRKTVAKSTKPAAEKPVKATKTTKKTAAKAQKPTAETQSVDGGEQPAEVKKPAAKKPARRTAAKKTTIKSDASKAQDPAASEKPSDSEAPTSPESPKDAAFELTPEQTPAAKKPTRRRTAAKKSEAVEPVVESAGEKPTETAPDTASKKPAAKKTVQKKESGSAARSRKTPSPEEQQLNEQWREVLQDRNLQGLINHLQDRFPEIANVTTKPQMIAHMKSNPRLTKAVAALIGFSYSSGMAVPRPRRIRKPKNPPVPADAPQEAGAEARTTESDESKK